ncbi:MAG: hypothetical protein FJ210_01120 [Betaproteobacteria bacterium]|nr:hypothetical protein [Betaproteobacteria bacterium]
MQLTLYRDTPVQRSTQTLPAALYNLTRTLLMRSPAECVFVPLRRLQYLAVIDRDEIVFVDSQYQGVMAISWQKFQPHTRSTLEDAVPYECVLYHADEARVQQRLPIEFAQALRTLAARKGQSGPASVLKFTRPQPSKG